MSIQEGSSLQHSWLDDDEVNWFEPHNLIIDDVLYL